MGKGIQASMSQELKEMERKNWRCEPESQARFIWRRVRQADRTWYRYTNSLELKPYPNPFSFGGWWGSGGAETEEELKKHIDNWLAEVEKWKKHGLVDIEVVEEDELELPNVPYEAKISEAGRPGKYRIDRQAKLDF